MQTLSEIVEGALREAQTVKVASLRDAPIEDRGFARVDQYLAEQLGQVEVETPATTKQASAAPAGTTKLGSALDDVDFALKLAQALVHGAELVSKLAGPINKSDGGAPRAGATPAGGPVQILKQPLENARVIVPTPQASAHARAAQANKSTHEGFPHNDEKMQLNGGPVIPSGYHSKDKKAHKVATERLLNSKIAQHKMLVALGQTDAADAVYKEAASIASQAGGNVAIQGDEYSGARVMPDNEGVRNLTKAQARDANQREAGAFFGEPVKKDNAVKAHMATDVGLKLSSATGLLRKIAKDQEDKPGIHERIADTTSKIRANVPLQTGASAVLGGALGGQLGHLHGGTRGAVLGGAAGALGMGALGYHGAKGEKKMRERLSKEAAKLAFNPGAIAKTVGEKAIGLGGKGLRAISGSLENAGGATATKAFRKTIDAQNALGRVGDTGKKIVGGTVLGAGALGAGGLARRALAGGDRG